MCGRSGERSRIGMALIPTSSERLSRFPPNWGGGGRLKTGEIWRKGGEAASPGGGVLEMKLKKKLILGKGERGRRPNRS